MSDVSKLTARSLGRLLDLLDSDRDRAAAAYERLRERAAGLLRWWGAIDPDELADITLDRVACKVAEGAPVTRTSLAGYIRGVARMVFYESRRAVRREPLLDVAAPEPAEESHALLCLDECLGGLDASERKIVLRYYEGDKIKTRQSIASELNITMTALRIRMHRARMRLEACVSDCMKRFQGLEHPSRA